MTPASTVGGLSWKPVIADTTLTVRTVQLQSRGSCPLSTDPMIIFTSWTPHPLTTRQKNIAAGTDLSPGDAEMLPRRWSVRPNASEHSTSRRRQHSNRHPARIVVDTITTPRHRSSPAPTASTNTAQYRAQLAPKGGDGHNHTQPTRVRLTRSCSLRSRLPVAYVVVNNVIAAAGMQNLERPTLGGVTAGLNSDLIHPSRCSVRADRTVKSTRKIVWRSHASRCRRIRPISASSGIHNPRRHRRTEAVRRAPAAGRAPGPPPRRTAPGGPPHRHEHRNDQRSNITHMSRTTMLILCIGTA